MILVTGSRGFIGTHFIEFLKEDKKEFYEMDLKIDRDILEDFTVPGEVTHVVHFAALRSVPVGEQKPMEFIETNCWGTLKLMRQFPKARFINISSSSVNEIRSVYGATKAFGEIVGRAHANCLSIRLYNVFGEGQSVESGAVIPAFCKAWIDQTRPTIYGDGLQKRDFTYVKDVVRVIGKYMVQKKNGVVHVGYGYPISVRSICQLICPDVDPLHQPTRGFEIRDSKCPTPMKQYYGRNDGLERTLKYYEKTRV